MGDVSAEGVGGPQPGVSPGWAGVGAESVGSPSFNRDARPDVTPILHNPSQQASRPSRRSVRVVVRGGNGAPRSRRCAGDTVAGGNRYLERQGGGCARAAALAPTSAAAPGRGAAAATEWG